MAVSALLGGAVLWGLFWWPLKELNAVGIHGSFVQAVAYGLPALVLLPWAWRTHAAWRDQIGLLLLIALLGGWANASFATSLTYGSVVRVLLCSIWHRYGYPRGTPVSRRPSPAPAHGAGTGRAAATLGGPGAGTLSAIDLLALSSGLAFALNNVAIRAGHGPNAARASRYSPVVR
jgi:hypothetical protein